MISIMSRELAADRAAELRRSADDHRLRRVARAARTAGTAASTTGRAQRRPLAGRPGSGEPHPQR